MTAVADFDLPHDLEAGQPPESRGLARDGVRLLVADGAGLRHAPSRHAPSRHAPSSHAQYRPAQSHHTRFRHARFRDLGQFLSPGDVLVVNTSATIAAAVDGRRPGGAPVTVHFSTSLDDGSWLVELRPPGRATGPVRDASAGERVALPAGAVLTLQAAAGGRLWRAQVAAEGDVREFLSASGRPISYAYLAGSWPLTAYQTVFARDPGSAEMPSAGRPFSTELVTRLAVGGVVIAPVTLHTGVSSLEAGEPPLREWCRVPGPTAGLVSHARAAGHRIIAVGTTVTRALETRAAPDGTVTAGQGWTDLVLGTGRPARAVDGIVTGWHAPGASHLSLLAAVAGPDLVSDAYAEAIRHRYLWHEFGDSCLLLR
jgi:S-adenosylmethionine:tRNA ribosyltransferase-isomerase